MFIAKGPGRFEIERDLTGPGYISVLLYNFDFDDFDMKTNVMKPEHASILDQRVVPLLLPPLSHVWVGGSASRIGEVTHNLSLSQVRTARVAAFLRSRGTKYSQITEDAVGEVRTAMHALDDERDRSVWVIMMPVLPGYRPTRRVPQPKISREFKLAMLTGFSVSLALKVAPYLTKIKFGVGVAMDVIFFMVWDTTNNLSCVYVHVGPLGAGIGLTVLPPFSFTTPHGPWNSFATEKPIGVWQFGKKSRFITASAPIPDYLSGGSWSKNWISLETPAGVSDVSEWISTGTTIGLGASVTVGNFVLTDGPSPFNGP